VKKSLFTAALTALLIVGLFATAAFAATWTTNPGTTVSDDGVVTLDSAAGPTSYETTDLGTTIEQGAEITFDFAGPCLAGAPRMYIKVDGAYYNTFDGNSTGDCGELVGNGTATSGTVSYTYPGPTGTITEAGLVNDNGTPSVLTISNVTIGGVEVIFTAGQCKDGGWVGSAFRNQGLCVASFN
jgi:hypothetical protein